MRRSGLRRRSDGGYRTAGIAAALIRLPSGEGAPQCHIHNSYLETVLPWGAFSAPRDLLFRETAPNSRSLHSAWGSQFLDIFVAEWRDDSTRRTVAHE